MYDDQPQAAAPMPSDEAMEHALSTQGEEAAKAAAFHRGEAERHERIERACSAALGELRQVATSNNKTRGF